MKGRIQRWNAAARRLAENERERSKGMWDIIVIPSMPGHLRHPDGGAAVTRPMFIEEDPEKGVISPWEALAQSRMFGVN